MSAPHPGLVSILGHTPRIGADAFVAPGAYLVGDVTLGPRTSVWFNAVLRADGAPIVVGENSSVQDLSMLHILRDDESPTGKPMGVIVGANVTVGHQCMLHGCIIEDDCLIGMGATVMNGVRIGRGSIVGGGAVVLENTIVPPFSLIAGNPATVRKTYDPSIIERGIRPAITTYQDRRITFLQAMNPRTPDQRKG
jgi:carbonic anhydrase/acetyltransferase-like protein (isoleucine patch superfamily)